MTNNTKKVVKTAHSEPPDPILQMVGSIEIRLCGTRTECMTALSEIEQLVRDNDVDEYRGCFMGSLINVDR